jgi:predicted DNA-binding transcriptional regulator YafY
MDATICTAINSKSIITFRYDEAVRRVEPHQVGYDHDGDLTLSAWQLSGGSGVDWRDFHIAKMSGLSITGEHFSGPRPGYNPRNRKMRRILCGL